MDFLTEILRAPCAGEERIIAGANPQINRLRYLQKIGFVLPNRQLTVVALLYCTFSACSCAALIPIEFN
jgi:hypothetical protein